MKAIQSFISDIASQKADLYTIERISKYLPYQMYDEEDGLYINDSSYGFMLEVTPLCGASKETVDILTGMITDGVPEGCAIQVINWASPKTGAILSSWLEARRNAPAIYNKIASKRVEYLKDANHKSLFSNPFLVRDFRVYITASMSFGKGSRNKAALIALKDQLKTTLQTSKMNSVEVLPDEFVTLVNEWINPNTSMNFSASKWNRLDPIKQHFCDPEQLIRVEPDALHFEKKENQDDMEIRTYSVRSFPEIWAQWLNRDLIGDFNSDFLRIPCPFMTVFSFVYGDEEKDSNKVAIKTLRATQKAGSGLGRFMPSVFEEDRDWKFVSDKIKKGQKLVKVLYQVTIFSNSQEIESCERFVRSLYKSKGWNIALDKYVQLQSWMANLPFMIGDGMGSDLADFGRLQSMVTWSCANLAPLQGEWKGMRKPKMLFTGRRGQLCYWDPFDNKAGNYNVAVIGKSGSGKSVFMQELVTSLVGANGQVIVMDDGRSFMNSCILQGGTFVDFGGDTNLCINPFSIVSQATLLTNPEYKEEVMHLLNLIIRQMCRASEVTSDVENSFIQDAIKSVWDQYGTKADVTHVAQYLMSQDDSRATDLGRMLNRYARGGLYERFFDGDANISLDQSFYVFELDKLKSKPDLQSVALMVLIFLVSEKMFHGDRSRTISLVIDEAWDMLHGTQFAEFIEGIARRARKYNGSLVTGTQSIDDYYKNPAATAAIQNTDWFCLLSQKKESVEAMKTSSRVKMDGEMEKALNSLVMVDHQYAEAMLYSSEGWSVLRLILDPYSVALYSSKGQDFAKIQELQASGVSLEEAIEVVANDIQRGRK